jgi:hypothetical protein
LRFGDISPLLGVTSLFVAVEYHRRAGTEDAEVNKLGQDAEAREKQADEFWKSNRQ